MSDTTAGLDAHLVVRRSHDFSLDVDLRIEPGHTAALLGPNGAGKSTIIDSLAGLRPLDAGHVRLGGRILDEPGSRTYVAPEHRRVGVVFQDYLLFGHLDVLDNIAFGPTSRGGRRRDTRSDARRWIEAFDLAGLEGRRPSELSGGQAQRVALARALSSEPELLLLDEPLAALDINTRSDLRRVLIHRLADHPGPRLVVTHDPTDAFLLADRMLVIEDGRLVQSGTPEEIRHRPATPYVAALAGTNLLTGTNDHGTIALDRSDHVLHTDDTTTTGSVLVTVHPRAIALHPEQPHGSPRNTWPTTVTEVEPLGDTTRIQLGPPVPLTADITPGAARALELRPGTPIWVAVKATEVTVGPA